MSNESTAPAPKPAPAYEPHMVMARRTPPDRDGNIEIRCVLSDATPILTVPLEKAARRAWDKWEGRPGWFGLPESARQSVRDVVLAICALKVREARSESRALPDRDSLARTIFGIMTFGGTWSSDSGILEMRSLCAADRALELCGAATGDASDKVVIAEALKTITRLTAERDAATQRADKAESEKRSADDRAEERWKERTKLRGEVNELRGQLETAQNLEREARFHRERAENDLKGAREMVKRSEESDAQLRARAEKAEAERDAARAELSQLRTRAVKAEDERDFERKLKDRFLTDRDAARAELDALKQPSEISDGQLFAMVRGHALEHTLIENWKRTLPILRRIADDVAARARAQVAGTTTGQIVPAPPTLAQLEAAEEKASTRFCEYSAVTIRECAILQFLHAEWGRAAAAVDAAREVK